MNFSLWLIDFKTILDQVSVNLIDLSREFIIALYCLVWFYDNYTTKTYISVTLNYQVTSCGTVAL
jgi:hypothetical protein